MEQCKPCLLEPVMKVEIEAPDEFAGALMGDLNGRRGRVGGMESKGRTTVINAQVPMAEMLTYGTQLTSMTQGKGSYRMEVDHYDIVPQLVAEKILANAKRPVDEEEEFVKKDATLENYTRRGQEKLAHLSIMQGRKPVEVSELHAGDLGAVGKLRDTLTGDTLGAKGGDFQVDMAKPPEPAMTYAIEPKSRADEDKLAPAIHKLMEEDLLIRFYRDPQTNEFLIAGAGQPHIEAIVSRLKKRYHAEVTLKAPKVPYLETIRAKAEAHGRHKKQSGGHGQFGDCKIRMEPQPRGAGFEFANEVFGGAIPRNFIPAIEKGIVETAARGYLAGYPVVDFKVTVFDGSYHDVDSNELSFKTAGRLAFKNAMEQCKPCLLEPVMKVEIEAPDEFAGALMGDLNGRRGRVGGMESKGRTTVINAQVPMAEMLTYGTQLTSMTQGKGSYRMEVDHYDIVPQLVAEKILRQRQTPHRRRGRITIASSTRGQRSAGLPAGCNADVPVCVRVTGVKSRHGARIFFRTTPRRRPAGLRPSPHSQSRPSTSLGKRRGPIFHHISSC